MRKFNITVNGIAYEVEVEEVGAAESITPVNPAPAAAPAPVAAAPKAAPAPKPAAPKAAPVAGGTKVNAPMPGPILDVKVSQGQAVKKGDILLILEAMKMENEILAPQDGSIAQVNVTKGASVNSGDVLVVLS